MKQSQKNVLKVNSFGSMNLLLTTSGDFVLEDHFILNGSKMWITNGPDADVLVVYAKTEPKKHQHGIT